MSISRLILCLPPLVACAMARAGDPWISLQPLMAQQPRESVYAPPTPPREGEGINEGAVQVSFDVGYFTDYIWRGIERFEFDPEFPRDPDSPPANPQAEKEDAANIQLNVKLRWDLGKLPSPFVHAFVDAAEDTAEGDSSFREIRPTVGFDWNLRPFLLTFGNTNYIFPESDFDFNGVPESGEVFARVEIDDSYFTRLEKPLLSPYVFCAYDYDKFEGFYIEAGVRHVMEIEETPITLAFEGHVAYVSGLAEVFGDSSGFQHYQAGMTMEYSLNQLFNFSTRYGDWSIRGYVYYTGGIDNDLSAVDQLWGGAGIGFRY
jgi:hypothetical protein